MASIFAVTYIIDLCAISPAFVVGQDLNIFL